MYNHSAPACFRYPLTVKAPSGIVTSSGFCVSTSFPKNKAVRYIRIKNRNYIYNELYKKKLNIKLNYLPPNHKDQCYSHIKRIPKLPVTEKICSEIINLPSHPYMSENEIQNISKAILKLVD